MKPMKCHECDSEVAENDQFCPYCGIRLEAPATPETPAAASSNNSEAELESTIMIDHADLPASIFTADEKGSGPVADLSSGDEPLENEADITSESNADGPEVPAVVIEDAETTDATAVSEMPHADLPEPEMPAVLADAQHEPELIDEPAAIAEEPVYAEPEPTAAETFDEADATRAKEPDAFDVAAEYDDIPEPSIVEKIEETEEVVAESSPIIDDGVKADLDDLFIPPIEETVKDPLPPSFAEEQEPQFDSAIDLAQPEDEAEIPAAIDDVTANEIVEEPSDPACEEPVAAAETPTDAASDLAASVENDLPAEPAANDQVIGMPNDELPEAEEKRQLSAFDSVRIMDGKDPVAAAESLLRGTQSVRSEGQGQGETTGIAGPDAAKSESTTGDPEGRKGSKLKPLAEGTVLNNRYEIIRKIGGGGMGAVYLASDNNLGGVLRAVKEMVQTHIEDEQQEKAINDFRRESMILSTLDHVSIPTIFDYFYDDKESRFYLVMKYISGGDLSARLRSAPEGKIEERKVTEWAVQIIDVLDYLHNQPSTIVYRDLKPSNIMIDGNSGRVMLIDFGIARSISQKSEKGVTAVGTMGYAPPELFSGNVEPRSDIYSLGSTMFHLLTGADPQSNPLLIFDFQKNPRPRQINPQLSDQMERILMKAVEYRADARFASAAEMRAALEEHLENLKAGQVTFGVSEVPASISLANQNVFCGFCGQRIVATDLFCAYCGAKQPIAQHGVHSEIYSESPITARLVVEGTAELPPPVFSLNKGENLVGRRDPMSNIFPEVDLSKYDPQTKISRRHAKIWRDGGNFLVEDLGSSNGTILTPAAGEPMRLVPNRPHALSSGDVIRVGDASLHFLIG